MAVPPNLLGVVESAGLAAVAYGRDTQEQINAAVDFVDSRSESDERVAQIIERVTQAWAEKSATLTSLAEGADLLVANMNDQELAANVAEYHGIPLAALHVFPARIMPSGWL